VAAGAGALVVAESGSGLRESQFAAASGDFAVAGDAQTSIIVLRGTTPGAVPGESVELMYGILANQVFSCEDGKAYLLEVECSAGGVQAGPTRVCQGFVQRYAVRRAAGLTTIASAGALDQFGDVAANDWSLVASIGAAPDRVAFTFTTGAIASACHVAMKLAFTEVAF
jgi:hypothetical protein